jgi:hypothetical protein
LQLDEELNNHYLELGDQSKSGYGAVDVALVRSTGAKFLLSRAASQNLGTTEVAVNYDLSESELQSMSAALCKILGDDRVQVL